MTYNQLPPAVVNQYAVVHNERVYDAIIIFKNRHDKWGALQETTAGDFTILLEPVYDLIGFNRVLNYLETVTYTEDTWQVDGNSYNFYDINGRLKASVPNVTTVRIDDSGRLLVLKDNYMGLLNSKGETMIASTYISLYNLQGDVYKAQRGGGYGIIDIKERVLLDFKYRYIFTDVKNDTVLVQNQSDRFFSFHFLTSELHALPYDRVFPAISNAYSGGRAVPGLYKTIRQCQETEFDYYGNGMSEYTGIWGMIESDGTVKIPSEYAFVDSFVNPDYFKVARGRFNFYFDETDRLIAEGVKWGVVDVHNNVVVPIEHDWVQEVGDTSWEVNKGGTVFFDDESACWTVQGGQSETIDGNS